MFAYQVLNHPSTVDASGLDVLEDVNHSLCLQALQLGMDTDEGTGATHTIAAYKGKWINAH